MSAKLALKYAGPQVERAHDTMYAVMSVCRLVLPLQIEAMQNIAKASQDRSVAEFEQVACSMVSVTSGDLQHTLAFTFLVPLFSLPPSLPPSLSFLPPFPPPLPPSSSVLQQAVREHHEYISEDPIVKVSSVTAT